MMAMSKKSGVLGIGAAVLVLAGALVVRSAEAAPQITVYKNPSCGCCNAWIDHLRDDGFDVRAVDTEDMAAIKVASGVHPELASCHTALVDGYAIEGHVPAHVIRRLLGDRPSITGLAVPGMPIGSPGMEMPGRAADPYDVLAFDEQGQTQIYESVR